MALTESKIRQIIREEARKMMSESDRTPRGLPTSRGEPRDQDPYRDVAYGRGDGGTRGDYPRGGEDEAPPRRSSWSDDDDNFEWGEGPTARELGFRVGDTVKATHSGKMGKVVKASDWDLVLGVKWEDGTETETDARFGIKKVGAR
jgi:hypothetical protein